MSCMFFRYLKRAPLLFVLFIILTPSFSYAVDQRCWTKKACETQELLGVFYGPNNETRAACGMDKDATEQPVGFCSQTGSAKTQISFGSKNLFTGMGDFIKWVYQYGIQMVGILAVVMIIVSGFQWVTSGGSQEKIGSAKKRIGGAMMGLFLSVMSYFILNMINPYLVNLRMPQVWKINTLGLVPPYCDQIKGGKKVSVAKGGKFDIDPTDGKSTVCGGKYFVEGTADLTCKGLVCGESQFCFEWPEGVKADECKEGNIGGYIYNKNFVNPDCTSVEGVLKSLVYEDWALASTDITETKMWAVCGDGDTTDVGGKLIEAYTMSKPEDTQIYAYKIDESKIKQIESKCTKSGNKFKGMVLMFEMNETCDASDEEHLIGKGGVDLGDEGWTDEKNKPKADQVSGALFAKTHIGAVKDDYFFASDELKKGITVNINANGITDIDEEADRKVYDYLLEK